MPSYRLHSTSVFILHLGMSRGKSMISSLSIMGGAVDLMTEPRHRSVVK